MVKNSIDVRKIKTCDLEDALEPGLQAVNFLALLFSGMMCIVDSTMYLHTQYISKIKSFIQ